MQNLITLLDGIVGARCNSIAWFWPSLLPLVGVHYRQLAMLGDSRTYFNPLFFPPLATDYHWVSEVCNSWWISPRKQREYICSWSKGEDLCLSWLALQVSLFIHQCKTEKYECLSTLFITKAWRFFLVSENPGLVFIASSVAYTVPRPWLSCIRCT